MSKQTQMLYHTPFPHSTKKHKYRFIRPFAAISTRPEKTGSLCSLYPRRLYPSPALQSSPIPTTWIPCKKSLESLVCEKTFCKSILVNRKVVDGSSNFRASPTDLLMTPCTAKLQAHKQKRFAKYISRAKIAN